MKENDPLNSVLQEWEAPEPSPALDERVRTAYRAAQKPSVWRRMWSFRVTIPVPVVAALLVMIAVVFFVQMRIQSPAWRDSPARSPEGAYVTRVETAGFEPLPNGAVRVIRAGDSK